MKDKNLLKIGYNFFRRLTLSLNLDIVIGNVPVHRKDETMTKTTIKYTAPPAVYNTVDKLTGYIYRFSR